MTSWKAIEIHVRENMLVQRIPGLPIPPESANLYHYIETSDGRRFLDAATEHNGQTEGRSLDCSDGNRCASVSFRKEGDQFQQVQVDITKHFRYERQFGWSVCPVPLKYFHIGLSPLYEALPKAQRTGEDTCLDRPCEVFLFAEFKSGKTPQDLVYHLDRATGVPLKVEAFKDKTARLDGKPSWVWQADSLDEIQGFHLPLSSSYKSFDYQNADDPVKIALETKVESLSYNKPYLETQFWPTIQPGTVVFDTIARTAKTVPDPKAATASPSEPLPTTGHIAAVPPRDWGSYVPPVGLGLGVSVLIVGLLLWMRRS
jgi:hypothetical protein